ncbi:MAG: glycosyltransferase [Mycobacterium sp.]
MKVAVAGNGSRGDIEPLAAVGRELLCRGHDVRMAVPPNMIGFVESVGLAAVAYGSDPTALGGEDFMHNGKILDPMTALAQHFTRSMAEWGAALTALADGADLLLTCANEQVLAGNAAEYYGIPLATLHFFPGGPSQLGGLIGAIAKDAQDTQRRTLGLPEAPGPSTLLEIQAYDELCFPGLAAQNFVGALTLELPTDADGEVLSWIADGTPPIYFGFGSNIQVWHAAHMVALISAACAELGERALICSGVSDFAAAPRLDHVRVVDAVNHAAVFPACRAVVHHGGAGTAAAGLRAGIPTLILWSMVDDQPIWAAAVERLKVGFGRALSDTTLASLVADLRAILTPQCLARAREVAADMTTAAESAAGAADLLEEAVRGAGV